MDQRWSSFSFIFFFITSEAIFHKFGLSSWFLVGLTWILPLWCCTVLASTFVSKSSLSLFFLCFYQSYLHSDWCPNKLIHTNIDLTLDLKCRSKCFSSSRPYDIMILRPFYNAVCCLFSAREPTGFYQRDDRSSAASSRSLAPRLSWTLTCSNSTSLRYGYSNNHGICTYWD